MGLSEASISTIRRAHAVHPITALQTEYSLFARDVETEILPTLRELGIGFVAYSPLGRGLLTSAYKNAADFTEGDYRANHPRFQPENFEHNLDTVARLGAVAQRKEITPAQLALAWLLHQGDDIVPIPGTKRQTLLEQNLAAAEVSLTSAELAEIGEIARPGVFEGKRYADMSNVNV